MHLIAYHPVKDRGVLKLKGGGGANLHKNRKDHLLCILTEDTNVPVFAESGLSLAYFVHVAIATKRRS